MGARVRHRSLAVAALLLVAVPARAFLPNPCGCPYLYIDLKTPVCVSPPVRVELGCKLAPDDPCNACCNGDPWVCTWTCPGDCNGNRRVSIDELTRSVGIVLGDTPMVRCRNADADRDGAVSVAEVVRAVRSALDGCE